MTPVTNGVILAVGTSMATSIVAKVTGTTALGLAAAWLARRNRAAVRHSLLAAAFGVALVLPIASIVAPPVRVAPLITVESRSALPPLVGTIDAIPSDAPANPGVGATPVVPRSARLSPSALLLAGWIVGAMLSLLPMVIGLSQIHSLRRSGLPWLHGQSVVEELARDAGIHMRIEVLLHEALPGPMTCGVVHPVIVLPRDAENWVREELHRAIVHELEHVRRGDWFSQMRCASRMRSVLVPSPGVDCVASAFARSGTLLR
jgi:beta-lactamase regulating signal transducer with metallopeptidase domain